MLIKFCTLLGTWKKSTTGGGKLRELKRLGLTLALYDFGTGCSSLTSVYQLPIDLLKINRSFVSQLEISEHHRVMVEATLLVAQITVTSNPCDVRPACRT